MKKNSCPAHAIHGGDRCAHASREFQRRKFAGRGYLVAYCSAYSCEVRRNLRRLCLCLSGYAYAAAVFTRVRLRARLKHE